MKCSFTLWVCGEQCGWWECSSKVLYSKFMSKQHNSEYERDVYGTRLWMLQKQQLLCKWDNERSLCMSMPLWVQCKIACNIKTSSEELYNIQHSSLYFKVVQDCMLTPCLCYLFFIGCQYHRGSILNFLYLRTKLCTAIPQNISQILCVRTNLRERTFWLTT